MSARFPLFDTGKPPPSNQSYYYNVLNSNQADKALSVVIREEPPGNIEALMHRLAKHSLPAPIAATDLELYNYNCLPYWHWTLYNRWISSDQL